MITAIILTKNEENNITDCLESLSFCDEILVVDDNSSDRTVEIAKSHKVKVVTHDLHGNFAKQRNFGLEKAKYDWVLFIDADERVSSPLSKEILSSVQENAYDGFYMKRTDELFGKKLIHGELAHKKFLRLAKRDKGKWKGSVHEEWQINGKIGELTHDLIHKPHQTISEFMSEINFYTSLRAAELHEMGEKSSIFSILFYTKGKFIVTFFIKMGFLDGVPGLILSCMMAFHSFLVRSKLYLLGHSHE